MKHNKKRNTAFLYEVLVREGTKAALEKDPHRLETIKSLILEFFNYSTNLGAELYLYGCLKKMDIEKDLAEKYLTEVKMRHGTLDKQQIFNEQTKLINRINKSLGPDVYNNFIPNYKDLATIAQIFNTNMPVKEKVLLEQEILSKVEAPLTEDKELKHIDNIVFKTFVNKFNEKYGTLLNEQKELLTRYIGSFADDGLELKVYINEEISALTDRINKAMMHEEIKNDKYMLEKTKGLIDVLGNFKKEKEISLAMMENVLKIQEFVHEVEKDD